MSRRLDSLARFILPFLVVFFLAAWMSSASGDSSKIHPIPSPPKELFSPSNARTDSGKLILVEQFFSAKRCVGCHQDTHAAWSESLHRNAAREPFYRESADRSEEHTFELQSHSFIS